jgi:hypothetical protein
MLQTLYYIKSLKFNASNLPIMYLACNQLTRNISRIRNFIKCNRNKFLKKVFGAPLLINRLTY